MAQGKVIPEVVHWIIIRLATTMSAEEISMYTDVGMCKVNQILSHFKETGSVKLSRRSKRQLHRTLCDFDIEVCIDLYDLRALFEHYCITAPIFNTEKNTGPLPR
jgi:hypothetical protein